LKKVEFLEELYLNKGNVTGAGLGVAARQGGLKHLKSLSVAGSPISLPGAKVINSLKTIESLDIGFITGMNDLFFGEFVEGLKNLKHLRVESSSGLTGQTGFAKLKASVHLETLSVDQTGVNDFGLDQLKGFKQLRSINLNRCNCTLDAVQRFVKLRPGCEVSYVGQKYGTARD
jgi:hypothetical protein